MPIQSGFANGYYNKVIEFMRNWLSGGLKDNPNLFFSALTGILRVGKEGIFSGLNNISVHTIFDKKFKTHFGFTEDEVLEMAKYYSAEDKMDEIKKWYNGYNFAGLDIYNPWSVINYFSYDCTPQSFWISTSSNDIIKSMLQETDIKYERKLHNLMLGNSEKVSIDLCIIYPDLKNDPDSIFSLLLLAGYLKIGTVYQQDNSGAICEVLIPNNEIRSVYKKEIIAFTQNKL